MVFGVGWGRAAMAAALVVAGSAGARAELGGTAASVQVDRARMGARLESRAMSRYTRHELTRGNGGTVRELTNAAGQVFAVTWAGPGKPDLRSLLGTHFADLKPAGTGPGGRMHTLRQPLLVDRADLRIQTEGHMGWFRGVAFIPSLAPAGFSPADLAPLP